LDALYERDGDRYVPTEYTRGPWSRDHQHAGPPSALLLRAATAASAVPEGQTVRAAFDILRPVPLRPLGVGVRTLRPGRNVEQLEAVLADAGDGGELMRARVWRMRREPVALPDGPVAQEERPGAPEDLRPSPRAGFFAPERAYADAVEWRFASGGWDAAGPACAWTRMKVALVAGEPVAPLEHLCVIGDAASGISAALDWRTWNFVNVDFDVSLEREPAGEWIAMDAVTRFGPAGAGVAHGTYADAAGRVGTSTQALLVGPR
jgi:hypothetical protein